MNNGFCLRKENEEGFVFVVCILLLFVLTIAGIATVRTSGTEIWTVRNQGQVIRELYDAETGLIEAFENRRWLTDDFLDVAQGSSAEGSAAEGPGKTTYDTIIDGTTKAEYRVRYITDVTMDASVSLWPEIEEDVPQLAHTAPPPVGSGDSVANFVTRRFAVTAKSFTGNTFVQGGVWISFRKAQDE